MSEFGPVNHSMGRQQIPYEREDLTSSRVEEKVEEVHRLSSLVDQVKLLERRGARSSTHGDNLAHKLCNDPRWVAFGDPNVVVRLGSCI